MEAYNGDDEGMPIPFVEIDERGNFSVNTEAMAILEEQ